MLGGSDQAASECRATPLIPVPFVLGVFSICQATSRIERWLLGESLLSTTATTTSEM